MPYDLIVNIIDVMERSKKIPKKVSTQSSLLLIFFPFYTPEVRIRIVSLDSQVEPTANRRGLIEGKEPSKLKSIFDL